MTALARYLALASVHKPKPRATESRKEWTDDEYAELIRLYGETHDFRTCAEALGHSENSCRVKYFWWKRKE